MGSLFLVLLVIIFIMLIVYVAMGVKIVHPYQKGVVEQLGRYKGTVEPGLRLIYPFVQRIRTVDMREQVIDVPPQEVITEDNVAVSVDAVVYFEPTDPRRLLYNISNFVLAVTKLAQTNLRNVIGEMTLDEAFTSRERVNVALREILDDATDKWGVRVVRVEIQRIDPPQDVMHAMHEQMKAERTRRAVVTEAEGAREAAVTRAEGEKAAAILQAEGQAQAMRTRAEAEQYQKEVVASGEAEAIRSVYSAITTSGTDDRVIAIKYLDTLRDMADGQATKIFLPADMSATMGSIGGIAELFKGDGGNGNGGSRGGTTTAATARPSVRASRRTEPSLVDTVTVTEEPPAVGEGQAAVRGNNPPLPPQHDILPPPPAAPPPSTPPGH